MTLVLTATAGAIAANPTGFRPPVSRNLEAFLFPGGNAERSRRNLWVPDGSRDAAVIGAPTYGEHYIRCTGALNFLELPFADPASLTYLIVASTDATLLDNDKPGYIGNFVSSTASGASLYSNSGTAAAPILTGSADFGATTRTASVSPPTLGVPRLMSVRVADAVRITVTDHTAGLSQTIAQATAREVGGGGNIRIGSLYAGNFRAVVDVYASAVYSTELTADEMATMETYLRGYFNRRSITI